jgi:predicted PurR-regulated permease PerM
MQPDAVTSETSDAAAAVADQRGVASAVREQRTALIERSLLLLLVFGLLVGVLVIVKPFTTPILFGAAVATAAWPLRRWLVRRGLGHGAAATILLLGSLAVAVLPVVALAPNLADQLSGGAQRAQSYLASSPAAPEWLAGLPLIGPRLTLAWQKVIQAEGDLKTLLAPYTADVKDMLVSAGRAMADSVVQLLLSLIVATVLWASGEALVAVLHDILRRLGGPTAEHTLDVAGAAIRSVAYGVVGTAVIQAFLLAFGLAIAGVPGAAVLGFVGLLLAISQIGAPLIILIWAGAAWWLFSQDHQLWGVFMIIWGLFISMIDNVIKPWLIGVGLDMPLSLTILGVFGGFVAFGFLGLFIGPTIIAIFFSLLEAWRRDAVAAEPLPPAVAEHAPQAALTSSAE